VSELIGRTDFWSTSSQTELAVVDPMPESSGTRRRRGPHGAPIREVAGFVPFAKGEIEQSIPERFAQQVKTHSQRIAVKSERYAVTYGALNRWANRVAHTLIGACGIGSEPIAMLLQRDAPHVAAILGVLKAGKFYVPLASSYPLARNQLILDDSQARWIVTDNANLKAAWELAGDTASIVNIDALDDVSDESDPRLDIAPDAYTYILYTSGSTGRPKGIVDTHRNVLHNIMNFTNDHYINSNDRILGLSSFAFSGSLKEIYGTVLNGGTLYPLDIEQVGLHGLAHWLMAEEISIFSSVSTAFRHFASSLTGSEQFPKLRVIRIGSEEVTWKDVEHFTACFAPGCVLVNGYGATETGTIRTYAIDQETLTVGSAVPIGYPVEEMEVRLLDDAGKRVGVNEIGQIAVCSAYLSVGYWQQPELTRQAFLPDPEGGERRLYLTGDLGVMEPDGCLIHAGRKDFQVKVRGNRVEVSEIETVLRAAPGVAEAVVVARSELPEENCLVAYMVSGRPAAPPSLRALREFLKTRLPDSSIPGTFIWLEAMPLNPNGKVDRKGLPAPNLAGVGHSRRIVLPRNEVEERLVAIWEDLTASGPIGIDDDFFEVGGNSLLAVRLFAEIHKNLGKNLPFETLVAAPTIEQLAAVVADELGSAPRPLVFALKASGSRPPFFAIPGTEAHPLALYELAKLSDPEQPFFGIRYPDSPSEQPYPTRIEDLAARFLPDIFKIQPEGPYRLGGHSFGGIVAFELAQQLIALGHEVSLLALFDTWGKDYPTRLPLPGRIADHFRYLGTLGFGEQLQYLGRKAGAILRRVTSRLRPASVESAVHDASDTIAGVENVGFINHNARCRYQPRVYPRRLVLFRAEQPDWVGSRFDDPMLGWGNLAAEGVEVHPVSGDHLTLLDRANVSSLSVTLNAYLRQ
jgi:amino acid adenylation domain-containing protein